MEANKIIDSKSFIKVFDGIKLDTIRRNSSRSLNWLFNKIKNSKYDTKRFTGKPKIGGMYVYNYDAKTKEKLPYWDATPIIILIDYTDNGFYGINWHYLPPSERKVLLKNILIFDTGKSPQFLKEPYRKLRILSTTIWKFAYKRYLWSHVKTKFVPIMKEEWVEAAALPIANFRKSATTVIYKDARLFAKKGK